MASVEREIAECRRIGAALSAGELAPGDFEAACARLVELAGHGDRKVRYAVADAARNAPDRCFDAVVPRLAKDPNSWVSNAAKSALKDRTAKRKAMAALEGQAGEIAALEEEIGEKDGKAPLRRARRLADLREAQLSRKLRHEHKKNAGALKLAAAALEVEASSPSPDLARLVEYARRAKSIADLQQAIVEAVCDVGEGARIRYAKESVRALVELAVSLLEQRATAKLAIRVDVPERLEVACDRGRVLMAFSNVLENAVEAYAEGAEARVFVSAREETEGSEVRVSFRDEGCGIRAEELRHVFAPLTSSKPGVRGMGLGNVKKMIESAHGGRVAIESTRGEGTTLHLTLPKEQGE